MVTNKEKFDQDLASPYHTNSIDFDVELHSIIKPELSDEMIKIEKSLVKKLDYIYVMPCLCMLVIIQFFDKSALNYSAVLGIKEDNNLDDTQFGWLGSIFFIGYLFYQIPNAYFVQKLNLGRYLGGLIFTWGVILGLTSMSKNFAHLAVFRFLLGVFEAGVFPCTVMLISRVYRRKEQAARIGAIYFTGGVSMTVGGILSYGIGHMDGIANMKAWQWVMIILGCATVIFGFVCFFLLIDDANQITKSENERIIIDLRIKDNAVVVTKKINYSQIIEALKESRFYCFAGFSFFVSLQNGALSVFSSIITQGFGFSNLNAILLSIPSGITDCIFIFIAIACQNRYKNSLLYTACAMLLVATLGLLLLIVIPINQAKLIGLYLCFSYVAAITMVMTSISNNVSGYTKKVFYNCAIIFFSTIGNFLGPQLMVSSQKPLYIGGMVSYMVSNILSIVLLLVARFFMSQSNKERAENILMEDTSDIYDNTLDITDRQASKFIYKL